MNVWENVIILLISL